VHKLASQEAVKAEQQQRLAPEREAPSARAVMPAVETVGSAGLGGARGPAARAGAQEDGAGETAPGGAG
jgi:hypothetical protein